jgi:TP901 family phage tail tape measure protein
MATDKSLIIKLNLQNEEFRKRINEVKAETASLQRGLGNLTKKSAIAFAALSGAVAGAALSFRSFEKDFTQIVTLLDKSSFQTKSLDQGINDLKKGVLDLRAASGESFEDLNKGLFDLISAGVGAEEAVASLAVATDLAAAGGTDVSIAVDAITTSINAFGLEASDAETIAQKFFLAQKNGKTTVADIANNLGVAASSAKAYGVSLDETLAATAAVTLAGKTTSQSLTGLNQVFANIAKPTAEAIAEAERLGIQFNTTALRSKGLEGFLNDLTQAQGFTQQSIEKLFGSVEAQGVAFALTGEQNKDFINTLKQLQDEAQLSETYQNALAESNATLDKALKKLGGSFQAALVTVGELFAPAIIKLSDIFSGLAKKIQGADERTLAITKNIAGFLLGVTGLTTVLGTFGLVLINIRNGLKILQAQLLVTSKVAKAFWLAIGGPIGRVVILALTAVAAAAVGIKKAFAENSPEEELEKVSKKLNKIEEKEKALQKVIENGSERQAARAKRKLNDLSKEKEKLQEIKDSIESQIAEDNIALALEERKKKIEELKTEKQRLTAITLTTDGQEKQSALDKIALIDEEINKLQELNQVKSESVLPEQEAEQKTVEQEPQEDKAQQEAEAELERLKEMEERKAALEIEAIKNKIDRVKAGQEEIEAINREASDKELELIRERNALNAERDNLELERKKLLLEQEGLIKTEKNQEEIAKELELTEAKLESLRLRQEQIVELENEFREEEQERKTAEKEADDLIQQIEKEQNIKFQEDEIDQLKRHLVNKDQLNSEFAKQALAKQQAENAKFLNEQRKFGTAFAKLNKLSRNENINNARDTFGKLEQLQRSSNSKLKAIGKAAALANIAIDTAKGALSAYASLAGIPIVGPALGATAAAAIVAFGAEQAIQVSKANTGAMVTKGIKGVDNQPFLLSKGESVIPADLTPELLNTFSQLKELKENGGLLNALAQETVTTPTLEASTVVNDQQNVETITRKITDAEEGIEPTPIKIDINIEEDAVDFITAKQRENQELGIGII